MRLPIFTEEEFVRWLDTGIAPERFEDIVYEPQDTSSHSEQIDLDHLSIQYLIRTLYCLFGEKRIPRKRQAAVTYSILEAAELQGLVIEQKPIGKMRSFACTERMTKYWSRMFVGDSVPVPEKKDLC